MFGLVGCPAFQTARKYFIIGSLISGILLELNKAFEKEGKEEKKEKERENGRMKGGTTNGGNDFK